MPASSPAPDHGHPHSEVRGSFLALFPSIMLPMFLAIIDQTIVATALPAIVGSLGGVERVSWVVVSYLVAATIAAPVYGRLGDTFGRRRLILVALVVFLLGSGLCALAGTIEQLAAARVLQGIGGGGMMTLSQALIGEAVPPRGRARFQGYIATVAVCSNTLGPVVGGLLTQAYGWRSVFLVNLPLGLVALLLLRRIPVRPGAGEAFRFDAMGLVLFSAFVSLLLVAVERNPGAGSAQLAVMLALAGLAALGLVWHERRTAQPLIPVRLLRHPAIWRCDALAALHGGTLVALVTVLPIYLRVVRGVETATIGLLLLPLTLGIGLGSMATGRLVSRTGRTTLVPSLGLPMVAVLLAGLALLAPRLALPAFSGALGLVALCMGTVMSVVQITVQTAAGPGMLGAASASVQFSRSIGAALGTALAGTVLFSSLVAGTPGAAGLFEALLHPVGTAPLPAIGPEVRDAIAGAFGWTFLAIAAYAATGAVLVWTVPLRRLSD